MKIKIGIKDRIVLPHSLPKDASILDQIIKQSIIDETKITVKDIEKYKIKNGEDGNISWEKDVKVEYDFSEKQIEYLKKVINDPSNIIQAEFLPQFFRELVDL